MTTTVHLLAKSEWILATNIYINRYFTKPLVHVTVSYGKIYIRVTE